MADTKHTPEPWTCEIAPEGKRPAAFIIGPDRVMVAAMQAGPNGEKPKDCEATANRIVACVNACVGMEDPMREIPHLLHTQELAREQREKAAEWGSAAYNAEVERMAAEIHEHLPDPSEDHNDRVDSVTESVDGSGWVMHAPDRVLEHSEQPQDSQEAAAMAGPDADWEKVRTVAAYLVMQQDVYKALSGLDDDAEARAEDESVPL